MTDQTIKADAGKPRLTLVPRQILYDIAKIREYGVNKYGNSENWKAVEIERYRDAAYRHFMQYLDDPDGNDEESGLPHLAHLACNIAFLCELKKSNKADKTKCLKCEHNGQRGNDCNICIRNGGEYERFRVKNEV